MEELDRELVIEDVEAYKEEIAEERRKLQEELDGARVNPRPRSRRHVTHERPGLPGLPMGMYKHDLRGEIIQVPSAWFGESDGNHYTARVDTWTSFNHGLTGEKVYGYRLYFPVDRQRHYMIENEVHDFYSQ